ncbi:MAG: hypothetical protein LUD68_07945 [Rikenellaceae bacterium]|nr:hypothetical protein [Rikenellaceae bacterium]
MKEKILPWVRISFISLAAFSLDLTGCSKDDKNIDETITVVGSPLNFGPEADSKSFEIRTEASWSISVADGQADWFDLSA